MLFSTVAAPTYIPTNSAQGSLFSTSLPTFVTCRLFDDSHSDRCEVISHMGFLYINLLFFIYIFLAVLGLRCCTRAFSNCGEQGLLFVAVHGLLILVASLVAEHGL